MSHLFDLGCSLAIEIFLGSPGKVYWQSGLRITGLKLALLPYMKGILTPVSFEECVLSTANIHFQIPRGPGMAFTERETVLFWHTVSYLETCSRSKGKLSHISEKIKGKF